MKTNFDIAAIGAGPAGMMSAIFAAKNGKKVVLLEKNSILGRKLLATGNGRCNLTNKNIKIENYHSSDLNFVSGVLSQFDQYKTIEYFESLGLILKEEDRGRMFPRTNQASTVVEALNHELDSNNVELVTDFTVREIKKNNNWEIVSLDGKTISASKLIIATGGKAAHQLGSSGDGIFWAQKLGHKITPIYAALVPIETTETWVNEISGIKIEAEVSIRFDDKIVSRRSGDLLFTHFGLSGPAIMSQAGVIAPLLDKGEVKILIDLFSESNTEELDQKLAKIFSISGAKNVKNALLGIAPANLLPVILKNAGVDPEKKAAEVSKDERKRIVKNIKEMTLTVKKIRPLKEAQVTSGGVDISDINLQTLESKIVKDLYFAGEVLDVDGDSGGFNLQWAWSSGYVAGINSAK